ncbi:MAG TPA: hypothetical protein DCW68_00285 [Rhodospirillaceae bacterium]|nr:MAG: hypothetical protein A2018_01600 [Alphaproteobacteria bacterium GWF2_58_20]HAU28538.1 hypothetical protein [Rhodospirillaceae bacterium]
MKKAILTLALIVSFQTARAEIASSWQTDGALSARLLSSETATGTLPEIGAGLEISLQEGTKLYWRSPGDAGIAPTFDWTGSENLKNTEIHWPAPVRHSEFGFESHVYEGHVLLPISLVPETAGKPLRATLELEALLCSELCTPTHLNLNLEIPAGTAGLTPDANRLAEAIASLPAPEGPETGTIREATFADGILSVTVATPSPLSHPDIFVETDAVASFDAPQVETRADGRTTTFHLRMRPSAIAPETLVGLAMTFTMTGGARALETTAIVTPPTLARPAESAPAIPETSALATRQENAVPSPAMTGPTLAAKQALPTLSAATIILMALLGGLILNVMPCVLPILSLKLLAVLRHGGAERRAIRTGFLASSAGILTFFAGLAGMVILLRSMGISVGWGFHFQQPAFIAFLMLLMLVFAANMAGLFEIPVPARLVRSGGGHFLEGLLAAVMATPCSAPFLGVTVGYALSRGPTEILMVFMALGFGLAAPFLLVALVPGLVKTLPKPGAWMVHLKRGLALALVATALWLGSVLAGQLLPAPEQAGASLWRPFAPETIPSALADGKTVLVSATADWCLTCKANEALVYENEKIRKALSAPQIVAMRANWTRRDEAVATFMASHGRRGVPFTIVFSGKHPQGQVLPEILTPDTLADALAIPHLP